MQKIRNLYIYFVSILKKFIKQGFFVKNVQKIIIVLCIITIVIGLYVKSIAIPKLKFEYVCPDSYGNQPVFKFDVFKNEYLEQLRIQYKLDSLFVDGNTELEKVFAITNWVHHLWSHDGWNEPVKKDAMSILQEVIENHKSFRCVEYSIVAAACLNAVGIPCRILLLRTADMQTRESGAGHVVNEVYILSLQKWVMVDVQANVVLGLSGLPLNAVELQKAIADKSTDLQFVLLQKEIALKEYINFIDQYLYYFQTTLEPKDYDRQNQVSIMLVPIGAKKPTVFQKIHPLTNVMYTHSVACFYPNPL